VNLAAVVAELRVRIGRFGSEKSIKVEGVAAMESAIRALNILSAVIMLAAGIYIQVTFWLVLSQVAQGLIGVTVLLYFFVQIDLSSRGEGNNRERSWR
jgi:hypothetical protein